VEEFMSEAVRIALDGVARGLGGPFGAVVVRGGGVIGRGANEVTSSSDPTAHAEVVAIRDACRRLGAFWLEGADLYATCEPCPMCLAAAYWARVAKVYFACTRDDASATGFADAGIYEELALPPGRRRLPLVQVSREEALVAFERWREKSDRIEY
jgi:tRNA(Arg) A34 adenosine deaminase TadA